MNNFGFKELYDVSLKTTYPIELDGRIIEKGETIAVFDKVQLATLTERNEIHTAHGGYGDHNLIWWEDTQEVRLRFTQGVFSKDMLALMSNSALLHNAEGSGVLINIRETLESDEQGRTSTQHPMVAPIFVYDQKSGEKLQNLAMGEQIIITPNPYQTIVVDYWYNYTSPMTTMVVGRTLTNGYLSLSGKTRVKDEITGQVTTGIINIPKLKLMSDLSMRLGADATPIVGTMDAVAIPVGNRGDKKIMEILFLEEDIDSDM